ncbi:element excision factor XisH family protein [Spirulina major]|uniref:element excision factor XisH family protein n=1 Tax=Spirulina major TaxID=270636 RepID=UPI0009352040|nr:element excision factor XisH family protein [Spirulina major]
MTAFQVPESLLLIDLAAHQTISAMRAEEKIAVEIKSFIGLSNLHEYHLALGQFLNYRLALKTIKPDRVLFLAVPRDAYQDFFTDTFIQSSLREFAVKLIIFHPTKEVILEWKH